MPTAISTAGLVASPQGPVLRDVSSRLSCTLQADPLDSFDLGPRLPHIWLMRRAAIDTSDTHGISRKDFYDAVHQMPKIELHAHLEGAVRPQTILDLAKQYNIPHPFKSAAELQHHIKMNEGENLLDFLQKFDSFRFVFDSQEMLKAIAYNAVKENASENIIYTEFQMNPFKRPDKVPIGAVIDSVLDGIDAAKKDFGVDARFIVSLNRSYSVESAWEVVREAVKRKDRGVVGIALGGDEVHHPPEKFREIFDYAHQQGLKVVIHAGEAQGPQSIRSALDLCKADRIDHGVRLGEDPKLLEQVRDQGIYLGMAATSNLQLGVIQSMKKFPLKIYLQQGLRAGMHTDDRAIFNTTLTGECLKLADKTGMTLQDIQRTQIYGAQASFLPAAEQSALVDKMVSGIRALNERLARIPSIHARIQAR